MAQLLRMPAVSADAESAVLLAWAVGENTEFATEDTLAEVETDKASVEIEAEADGVLLRALVTAGSEVAVGAPIALIGTVGEAVDDIDALLTELGVSGRSAAPAKLERREVPDEPSAHAEATVGETLERESNTVATSDGLRDAVPTLAGTGTTGSTNGRVFASPLARRMARDSGLPLDELTGTGPNGRIRRIDIEVAMSRATPAAVSRPPVVETDGEAPTNTAGAEAITAAPSGAARSGARYTDQPHSKLRRLIASRLTQSKATVPHFYLSGSARVEKLVALRSELNEGRPVKISVNDLIIKAAARAHELLPAMNVVWTDDALREFHDVDISVAVASPRGLVTPTLRAVQKMSIGAVSAAVKDFVQRAGDGKLRQDELEGGALSVSNLGMFGTESFSAIINPPQSAILAVGAIREEAVVQNGELKVGQVMRVTLSVDHRAIDGAQAAQWLSTFLSVIEKPLQILS